MQDLMDLCKEYDLRLHRQVLFWDEWTIDVLDGDGGILSTTEQKDLLASLREREMTQPKLRAFGFVSR